jgi:hypothetical protein
MAGMARREASKQRVIAMATTFEARAKAADGLTTPNSGEVVNDGAGRIVKRLDQAVQHIQQTNPSAVVICQLLPERTDLPRRWQTCAIV